MNTPQFTLSSPAFKHGAGIPSRYTCDGADVSPPLLIAGVPSTARSLALIVDDPDAPSGMWSHWLVWNIDPRTSAIPEGTVPVGAVQGTNDFRRAAYGGPCPPSGTHRYFFKLYALDVKIDPGSNATRKQLEAAIKAHIAGYAELIGVYTRI